MHWKFSVITDTDGRIVSFRSLGRAVMLKQKMYWVRNFYVQIA